MPKFPEPTHGPLGSGLTRFTTIWDVARDIPESATCHRDMMFWHPEPKGFYDPETQCPCLTTGLAVPHWNGFRDLTPREHACIQTFPMDYDFVGTKTPVKTQIGNAVPPKIWKVFIQGIMETLDDWRAGRIDGHGNRTAHTLQNSSALVPQHSSRRSSVVQRRSSRANPSAASRSTTSTQLLGSRSFHQGVIDLTAAQAADQLPIVID